jgi:hypothetical protein
LAAIAAGEVVFPDAMQVSRPGAPDGDPGSRPGLHWSPIQWQAQAGELRAVAQAGAVGELSHVDHGSNQAATVDAGSAAVYNAGESHNHLEALTSGDAAMASPVYVLVLPVDLAAMQTVLQALAPVLQSHATNGHREAEGGSPPRLPRKTYLSDTPCPHGHVWRDTGKVLRFRGNNQCVPCSGQRTPRAKALATTES